MKKIYCIFLLLMSIFLCSCSFDTRSHIEIINSKYGLNLPEELEKEYTFADLGFQGEGTTYHVYKVNEEQKEEIASYTYEPDKKYEEDIMSLYRMTSTKDGHSFKLPEEYKMNITKEYCYLYRYIPADESFQYGLPPDVINCRDILFILYFELESRLYVLRHRGYYDLRVEDAGKIRIGYINSLFENLNLPEELEEEYYYNATGIYDEGTRYYVYKVNEEQKEEIASYAYEPDKKYEEDIMTIYNGEGIENGKPLRIPEEYKMDITKEYRYLYRYNPFPTNNLSHTTYSCSDTLFLLYFESESRLYVLRHRDIIIHK